MKKHVPGTIRTGSTKPSPYSTIYKPTKPPRGQPLNSSLPSGSSLRSPEAQMSVGVSPEDVRLLNLSRPPSAPSWTFNHVSAPAFQRAQQHSELATLCYKRGSATLGNIGARHHLSLFWKVCTHKVQHTQTHCTNRHTICICIYKHTNMLSHINRSPLLLCKSILCLKYSCTHKLYGVLELSLLVSLFLTHTLTHTC